MAILYATMFASGPVWLFAVEVLTQPGKYNTLFALGACIFSLVVIIGWGSCIVAYGHTKVES